MDHYLELEVAYAAARARGRDGNQTRKNLRRAAKILGTHLVTDTFKKIGGDGSNVCATCGGRLVKEASWYRHEEKVGAR